MLKRCYNCFELYEDIDEMCPHCGYTTGDKAEEVYYLQPGTLLNNGKYIVGEKAGQGGFGIIYKAWNTNLQCMVAIKEFFPLSMVTRNEGQKEVVVFSSKREKDYEKHLNKFKREAKIMSMFTDSENCIRTYDVFEENGTAYIVMEYCNTPTLKSYLKSRNGELLPEREVNEIISQVLSGVGEIHAKGVYHLDIALDNIFIKRDNDAINVTIYDFGAARLEKEIKKGSDDEIILKPGFAPPEQYKKNGKIGPWTDIYAVGANLYYLLTGTVPLEATDREKEDVMEEPAQLEEVSPAINNATLRAMALAPELRYKNAKEFMEDLKKEKVRSDKEEAIRRKKARNRFIALISATLLIAIAVIVYVGYTKGHIFEDKIVMWVAANEEDGPERQSYEAVIASFREHYPQVEVELEVMPAKELERRFLEAGEKDRPDILETSGVSNEVLKECVSLASILKDNKDGFVSGIEEGIVSYDKKQVPLGLFVSVIYKQAGKDIAELTETEVFDFVKDAIGYVESDTTLYATIQKSIPGKYDVIEGNEDTLYLTEQFSVFSKSRNKEKAAKALLNYLLTDAAQEIIHITYRSDYLPVSNAIFELYIKEVFRELQFLEETIGEYTIR